MAFDYGSIDLGLRNPFKLEGKITALRGLVQSGLGGYLLFSAASIVKEQPAVGWILVIFGFLLLGLGIRTIASGIYANLRFFVGRNHPTSLAPNYSKSESSTAREEASYVYYDKNNYAAGANQSNELEEMLIGRKNTTFKEPKGFIARAIHSVFPKLLYMPFPVRNLTQNILGAWVKTLVAIVAFAIISFVSLAGFAGEMGEELYPAYSVLITLYLLFVWSQASMPINRDVVAEVQAVGAMELVKVITVALIVPVVIGVAAGSALTTMNVSAQNVKELLALLPSFHPVGYIIAVLVGASLVSALSFVLIRKRMLAANPVTEVSELRENIQESVHPKEIFINLDNLVMANRRYKEVPNRVYRELEPHLDEQVDGKGSFKGEMIQEIQPKVKAVDYGSAFNNARLVSLLLGNALHIGVAALFLALAYAIIDVYGFINQANLDTLLNGGNQELTTSFLNACMYGVHIFLIALLVKAFANILTNAVHVFFAEIQFESLLVYFKCEGTFTESKISTGTGIHDSTRSENVLVRSSITPWVVVSKIVSTTFAASGMRNLEFPRVILEMHKDNHELDSIMHDVKSFLKDRESIASITSERDLGNASQIYSLNQQTRATTDPALAHKDDEAAGYLRQEEDLDTAEEQR